MPTYPVRGPRSQPVRTDSSAQWLDVGAVGSIHATSEDPQYPVRRAFLGGDRHGWRAAVPGAQVIEVHFREPRDVTRIRLVFDENGRERTQQFTISWSARRGERHGEAVRQQFNFSPQGATREVEDYVVSLSGIETLTIEITPDISGRSARASLTECRLA